MAKPSATDHLAWLWAFPLVYAFHLVEEGWAGADFPHWIATFTGRLMPQSMFLALNGVGMAAMVGAIWAGQRWLGARWLLVCVATTALVNGMLHLLGSLVTDSVSPGLFTGLFLWAPLGVLALAKLRQCALDRYRLGLAIGLLVNGVVLWLAVSGVVSRTVDSAIGLPQTSGRNPRLGRFPEPFRASADQNPVDSKNRSKARLVSSSSGSKAKPT